MHNSTVNEDKYFKLVVIMIKTEELSYKYSNDISVLKEIDLYLENGEFVGIIGPNGSGKSTLLKNIAGLLEPTKGYVFFDNQVLNSYNSRDLARRMAVVPQDTSVNYNFKVIDIIMMGRNPYQNRWGTVSSNDREIVERAMELTDTCQLNDKIISELSGGERQRVIIARALAQQPEIIILDEPTASLDINYQGEIFNLLAELNREQNLTILVVSHDLNLSAQYCSRLIMLSQGKIFKTGTPETVLTEENIRYIYRTTVQVKENPLSGKPYIIMSPRNNVNNTKFIQKDFYIHIIGGGGSAKDILKELYQQGYQLSCGVLNTGDSDWETARRLGITVIEVPPFNPVDDESLARNRRYLERADLIIVAAVPFGHGNLENMALLLNFKDKKMIFIDEPPLETRDFTGGRAINYWNQLKKGQAFLLKEGYQLLEKIKELIEE